MPAATIRDALVQDALAISRLHCHTWRVAYKGLVPDDALAGLDESEFYERWTKTLNRCDLGRRDLVAEVDGAIAGFVAFGESRDEDAGQSGDSGEVFALYVHPRAWGRGVGRALLTRALEELRPRFRQVTLWVLANNTRARRFYEHAGMQADGSTKTVIRYGAGLLEARYFLSFKESPMFDRLSHVMMYVKDIKRALEFYKGKLGFTANFESPHFASLRHDAMKCRLDLHPTEADSRDVGFGPIPYFIASDFDGAVARLKQVGVKVGQPRREGDSPRFVTFWDSEGNALGLEEPR